MADNSQKMSYQAGEVKGQAQEKANTMMDKAGNAAQSAKDSMNQVQILLSNHAIMLYFIHIHLQSHSLMQTFKDCVELL